MKSELDDTVPAERPITVEDVLSFHLGFGSIMDPGPYPIQRAERELAGVLIERVAGRPLGEVLRERIFEPLGMTDTSFYIRRPTDPPASPGSC